MMTGLITSRIFGTPTEIILQRDEILPEIPFCCENSDY